MNDSSTAKNITEEKKISLLVRGGGQEAYGNPHLIVSFHGSPVLFSVLQGRPRFPSKTWNRESVGEGRGGEARGGVGERGEGEEHG